MLGIFIKFCAFLVLGLVVDAGRPVAIVGGTDAEPGEFPYQVLLVLYGHHPLCGGTLISDRHILTGAHCFVGISEPPYEKGLTILTGATDRTSDGEYHEVSKVTVHSGYKYGRIYNCLDDVAVITLARPVKLSKYQKPIALPTSPTPRNVLATLSGWGFPGMGTNVMVKLQKRTVHIIEDDVCGTKVESLDRDQICGYDGPGTGFCTGDSGGPLTYNNTVVGIVSHGFGCGMGLPDIYTDVYKFVDYIKGVMAST